MADAQADTGLLRRVAWLGLGVILCVSLGATFGALAADGLGIQSWMGYVAGFVLGYLLCRTLLRRFFWLRLSTSSIALRRPPRRSRQGP